MTTPEWKRNFTWEKDNAVSTDINVCWRRLAARDGSLPGSLVVQEVRGAPGDLAVELLVPRRYPIMCSHDSSCRSQLWFHMESNLLFCTIASCLFISRHHCCCPIVCFTLRSKTMTNCVVICSMISFFWCHTQIDLAQLYFCPKIHQTNKTRNSLLEFFWLSNCDFSKVLPLFLSNNVFRSRKLMHVTCPT